jgi:hypothetical protein
MAFSASESAFEGFRIIRREPTSIAVWAVFYLIADLVMIAGFLPVMGLMTGLQTGGTTGAANLASLGGALLRLYAVLIPWALITGSMVCCGVYRAVLRPDDKGVGRLKFGVDELRLIGLWVVLGLLYLVVSVVIVVVFGIAAAALAAATQNAAGGAVLFILLLYLLMLCAFAWLAVRLSFAGPMTFAERKLRIFGGWGLTRRRFWPLLGCYLLALVFLIIIWIVAYGVMAGIGLAAAGGSIQSMVSQFTRPDYSSLQGYFNPLRIAYTVLSAPIGAVVAAITFAPAASAYKALTASSPEQQAEVFG